jgi:hypothetical protein
MKRTLLMFAFGIICRHLGKTENSHEVAKQLALRMTTEQLIELSATAKEAEVLSKEYERRYATA